MKSKEEIKLKELLRSSWHVEERARDIRDTLNLYLSGLLSEIEKLPEETLDKIPMYTYTELKLAKMAMDKCLRNLAKRTGDLGDALEDICSLDPGIEGDDGECTIEPMDANISQNQQ